MPVPRTSSKIVDCTGRRLLPIGSEDFTEVVTEHVYVDKTSLICDLLDSSYKVTLLCRPRRFGKSLAMRMLQCFFETPVEGAKPPIPSRKAIFESLSIWRAGERYRAQQGGHPVIFLSLGSADGRTWDSCRAGIPGSGLGLATFVTILGLNMDLMSPRDFIQQPARWVNQLHAEHEGENVYSVIPNFAMDLAMRYGLPAARTDLDLSQVDGLILGSEPVTEKSMEAFISAFAEHGLHRAAVRPSYGLAEASLLVTTPQTPNRPLINYFDREALSEGRGVVVARNEDSVSFASNGQVVRPQLLAIVDPETRAEVPDGTVGELWCYGANIAAGYLNRPEETEETFHNTLVTPLVENSRATGAPADAQWLATGDLAVIVDNEVYITGRLKDLIIIAGRNHYPQDIEYTVAHASAQIRPAAVAAFAVEGDDVEQLIILAERDLDKVEDDDADAIAAIRAAVTEAHGVVPADIRITAPDTIIRSSAGKIARRVNKKHYQEAAAD